MSHIQHETAAETQVCLTRRKPRSLGAADSMAHSRKQRWAAPSKGVFGQGWKKATLRPPSSRKLHLDLVPPVSILDQVSVPKTKRRRPLDIVGRQRPNGYGCLFPVLILREGHRWRCIPTSLVLPFSSHGLQDYVLKIPSADVVGKAVGEMFIAFPVNGFPKPIVLTSNCLPSGHPNLNSVRNVKIASKPKTLRGSEKRKGG